MIEGITAIIYPIRELAKVRAVYGDLFGEPIMDQPYYVGFRVGGLDVGLDPNGHNKGYTGPVCFWTVDDIHTSLKALTDAGAEVVQEPMNVGGGKLIASVKDADGNMIGLAQQP